MSKINGSPKRWLRTPLLAMITAVVGLVGIAAPAASANPVAHVGSSTVTVSSNGSTGTLAFYWIPDSSNTPHSEVVPSNVPIKQEPAVAQVGQSSVIAAEGTDGSLQYYWQPIGSPTWHEEQVAGAGSTTGIPDITQVGNSTVIAAPGPNYTINYYYQPIGSPTWSSVQIVSNAAGAPSSGYSWPSITQVGGSTVIAAEGPNFSLWMFWQAIGSPTWHAEEVSGNSSAYGIPSVAAVTTGGVTYTEIAALREGPQEDTAQDYTYMQAVGASGWTKYMVTPALYGLGDPSLAQVGGDVVLTTDADELTSSNQILDSQWLYVQHAGNQSSPWTAVQVTPWGGAPGAWELPGVTATSSSIASIAVALDNGSDNFYQYNVG